MRVPAPSARTNSAPRGGLSRRSPHMEALLARAAKREAQHASESKEPKLPRKSLSTPNGTTQPVSGEPEPVAFTAAAEAENQTATEGFTFDLAPGSFGEDAKEEKLPAQVKSEL